jgi:hypothetical protein
MAPRSWILPLVFGLTSLNSWVLFEEFVVNRYGLWKYMPFYRVSDPCVWDLSATITIVVLITALRRSGRI